MIKITLSEEVKKEIELRHLEDIKERLLSEYLTDWGEMSRNIKRYYDFQHNCDENIKKLIIGDRGELEKIIQKIGKVNVNKNLNYKKAYSNFSDRKWAYELLKILNVNVCPYCNRQYTFTLKKSDGIRPQFDHYFPISKYPYLQVSLYNLIPSCNICNLAKSDLNTYDGSNFFYPYEEEFGYDVNFNLENFENTQAFLGLNEAFDVIIKSKDTSIQKKVDNVLNRLKLDKLYEEHKDYARDIIRKSIIYNESYIADIYKSYSSLFKSENDLRNTLFMNYLDKDEWGKRPLSKFSHDIHKQMKKYK